MCRYYFWAPLNIFHNFVSFHPILMFLTILESGDETNNLNRTLSRKQIYCRTLTRLLTWKYSQNLIQVTNLNRTESLYRKHIQNLIQNLIQVNNRKRTLHRKHIQNLNQILNLEIQPDPYLGGAPSLTRKCKIVTSSTF